MKNRRFSGFSLSTARCLCHPRRHRNRCGFRLRGGEPFRHLPAPPSHRDLPRRFLPVPRPRRHTFPFPRPDILALQEYPSAPEEPLAALLSTQPHPLPSPAATTPASDGYASAENSVRSAPIFAATVPGTIPSPAASSTSAQAVPSGYGRIRFERIAFDLAAHVVSFFTMTTHLPFLHHVMPRPRLSKPQSPRSGFAQSGRPPGNRKFSNDWKQLLAIFQRLEKNSGRFRPDLVRPVRFVFFLWLRSRCPAAWSRGSATLPMGGGMGREALPRVRGDDGEPWGDGAVGRVPGHWKRERRRSGVRSGAEEAASRRSAERARFSAWRARTRSSTVSEAMRR